MIINNSGQSQSVIINTDPIILLQKKLIKDIIVNICDIILFYKSDFILDTEPLLR